MEIYDLLIQKAFWNAFVTLCLCLISSSTFLNLTLLLEELHTKGQLNNRIMIIAPTFWSLPSWIHRWTLHTPPPSPAAASVRCTLGLVIGSTIRRKSILLQQSFKCYKCEFFTNFDEFKNLYHLWNISVTKGFQFVFLIRTKVWNSIVPLQNKGAFLC